MMLEELKVNLIQEYCPKDNFKHRKAELIRLFPYITSGLSLTDEDEFKSYWGLCGEVSRRINGYKKCETLNVDVIKADLKAKIETDDFDHLLDIVKLLAFDETGAVTPFALSAIPYLSFSKDSPTLREMGHFLDDVFFHERESQTNCGQFSQASDTSVLHSLIHACFPPLDNVSQDDFAKKYHRIDVGLSKVFKQDWMFLCDNPKLLHTDFPKFLKLYSLLYQLRVVEKLNQFFDESELDPLYFTLTWESCSATRTAYKKGWKRLEPKVKSIFSHVNCLELLNHISVDGLNSRFTYVDLKQWSSEATNEQKKSFERSLDYLIDFYRDKTPPKGGWEEYEPFDSSNWSCDILNKSHRLWMMVDCQFVHSDRNAAAGRYSNWLTKSTIPNFEKNRGRNGNTLAFSRDQIMFLTKLAVGRNKKLRLHDYWNELERRGIAFDNESRRKIVVIFERLNLLEKKSDSGDAQYVRAII